jgi:uncharacterized SAM-binding protein YcdF (DUF218 family)
LTAFRRFCYISLLVFLFAAILLTLNHEKVLLAAGNYLVETRAPEKADAALVLAGDYRGKRVVRAAELVRQGFAPVALVSGPMEVYGVNEASLAIQFATRRGFPESYFEPLSNDALSTFEEARAIAPELRRRNIRRLLLVTSNYHTHRAAGIFRKELGPNVVVQSIAAPDMYFEPGAWWQNREGRKVAFYEYSKMVAGWMGM